MIEAYLDALDLCYFEASEAFKGLADENLWKRPTPTLLSVGEIAGHVAFWQAVRLAGQSDDPTLCSIKSPLIDSRFRYYDTTLAQSPSDEHLAMTAQQVIDELVRINSESITSFRELNPDPESSTPETTPGFSYLESVKYLVFHVSYHIGQIYTVRHLLGEITPDN